MVLVPPPVFVLTVFNKLNYILIRKIMFVQSVFDLN